MESIIQTGKECYVCGTTLNLHKHHVFGGTANRKLSERYGLTVILCARHHNMSNEGAHFNRDLDMHLKQLAQKQWEAKYGNRKAFMTVFGKNYIESED